MLNDWKRTDEKGGFVYMNPDEESHIDKLRMLSKRYRADAMGLSNEDMREIIAERREEKIKKCIKILDGPRLRWNETDGFIEMDDVLEYENISKSKWKSVRANLRKRNIEDDVLDKLLAFLTSDQVKQQ